MIILKWLAIIMLLGVMLFIGAIVLFFTIDNSGGRHGWSLTDDGKAIRPFVIMVGFIVAAFCGYGIYKLLISLNIIWPIYITLALFLWILVVQGFEYLESQKKIAANAVSNAIRDNDVQAVQKHLRHPLLSTSDKARIARSTRWDQEGNEQIARLLTSEGQEVGGAALCSAVHSEKISVINVLLAEKINPNRRCDDSYLATVTHNPVIIDALITAGMDLNYRAEWRAEPVFISLLGGAAEYDLAREAALLSALQKAHISYNSNNRGRQGETALIIAARKDYAKVANFLLENGADPNLRNDNNETALMNAQGYKMARLLLEKKAKRDLKNSNGETATDILRRLQLDGAIAAMNNLEQPASDALITAIKSRDFPQVVSLKNIVLSGQDERAVMLSALRYGTIEMLNALKPIFDSAAHKHPGTDYMDIVMPVSDHPQEAGKVNLDKAEWIVRNNYIFDNNKAFKKFLESIYYDSYSLHPEDKGAIRLQADIKERFFSLKNPNVTKPFGERIHFSALADLQLDKNDVKYLRPVIQYYTWEETQKLVSLSISLDRDSYLISDVTGFNRALTLFDEWISLHAEELEKHRWFEMGQIISDISDINPHDLAQLKRYLKQVIPRRLDVRISDEAAKYLMASDPLFVSGKYDLTPFLDIGGQDVTEEERLQSAFDRAFADIEALDRFLNLAKSFAGKDRRVKRHVPLIVNLFAPLLVEVVGKSNFPVSEKLFSNFMENIYPATADVQDEAMSYGLSVIASQGLIIAVALKNAQIRKLVFEKLLGEKFDITTHENRALIYNLACFYAIADNKTAILEAIRQSRKREAPRKQFMDDLDFKNYWSDVDFLKAVN